MIRFALAFGLLAAATAPSSAQIVAAQAGAEGLARRCAAAGGKPREAAGLVREIALGGRTAAALDAQRFSCAGAAPVDCGPFGCKLSIYLGSPVAAFETYVKAWRARAGRLEIMRVGAYCAGTGESCSETYQLAGEGLTLAGKGQAKFATDPAPRAATVGSAPAAREPAERLSGARARRLAARTADVRAQQAKDARDKTARPGRASTRGKFEAGFESPPTAQSAPSAPAAAVAPGVAAERRRRLDAAPYVP